jgi:hypothetical protein
MRLWIIEIIALIQKFKNLWYLGLLPLIRQLAECVVKIRSLEKFPLKPVPLYHEDLGATLLFGLGSSMFYLTFS